MIGISLFVDWNHSRIG